MMNRKKTSAKVVDFDDGDEDVLQEIKWNRKKTKSKDFKSDEEDGLKTILEVPIPEEMYGGLDLDITNDTSSWRNLRYFSERSVLSYYLMNADQRYESLLDREFIAMMKLVGSPFVPTTTPTTVFPPQTQQVLRWTDEFSSLEAAKAKYILHQYVAASGRQEALNSVESMYVVGQTKMLGPNETHQADDNVHIEGKHKAGSFALCQQNPNLWHLEMIIHGFEFNAGSDGNVSWHQTSWRPDSANKGPPRLLRRFFQGLEPKTIASLFSNAVCVGEKKVKHQDCFILELQIAPTVLKEQSSSDTDIINYSLWGYFSQKTGLLIQLTDIMLLRTKTREESDHDDFWKIRIESQMEDYRNIDGIKIAHAGKTRAILDKFGANNGRWKVDELWRIEEVHFNFHGLSMDNFLPPTTTYP